MKIFAPAICGGTVYIFFVKINIIIFGFSNDNNMRDKIITILIDYCNLMCVYDLEDIYIILNFKST